MSWKEFPQGGIFKITRLQAGVVGSSDQVGRELNEITPSQFLELPGVYGPLCSNERG